MMLPGSSRGGSLIPDLQSLGFSDYEARAYISLLKVQPATAYEVSKDAGIPKANCYTVLESLSKKESVQPVSENPTRYVALPPEVLFERIAQDTEARCNRVKAALKMVGTGLSSDYVWSLSGEEAVSSRIERIIESAGKHLWIKATEDRLLAHRPALERCAARGVTIRIIFFGTRPQLFEFGGPNRTWLHEGNGLAVGLSPYLFTIARDYEEALVAEFRETAHASVTRNRAVVNLVDSLIRHEIYLAEIFEEFGELIQGHFGTALLDLRQKYLPEEQVAALKLRLDRAAVSAE